MWWNQRKISITANSHQRNQVSPKKANMDISLVHRFFNECYYTIKSIDILYIRRYFHAIFTDAAFFVTPAHELLGRKSG